METRNTPTALVTAYAEYAQARADIAAAKGATDRAQKWAAVADVARQIVPQLDDTTDLHLNWARCRDALGLNRADHRGIFEIGDSIIETAAEWRGKAAAA